MHSTDGEILIATLDRPDFERARQAVQGFTEWPSFDDYQCDRDGWVIGLASAGQCARSTSISIDHFLLWSACSGVEPTAARLDEFAKLVDSFRRNPRSRFNARLSNEPPSGNQTDGDLIVPVDSRSYREWLECLGTDPSDSLLNVYAGLLLELWADKPYTPTFADNSLSGVDAAERRPT